jgi:deazaflavin-dependent oxidoreductase (nitroreductase family)
VNARLRLLHWSAHKRSVAFVWRRFGSPVDRVLYAISRGRLSIMGPNVLLLTTTGRRSGQPRTTPVIFVRAGAGFVISSENYGQRRRAAWPLNLDANRQATVQVGARRIPCRARRLSDHEADGYWERLLAVLPAHATYLKRSGERHTFVLDPDSA